MALVDDQAPIDAEIVKCAITSTPEEWNKFVLLLNYSFGDDPDDLGTVTISLQNETEFGSPEVELYEAAQKLNKLYHRYGVAWVSAKYLITLDNDGMWQYEAEFQY